jgi:LysM repeat protein
MLHLKGIRWIIVAGLVVTLASGGLRIATAGDSLLPDRVPQASTLSQAAAATVSGTARAGDTVRVYQGETLIGETVAGANGAWQVPVPELASRTTPFRVQIIPPAQRGAGEEPEDGERVTILVSVVVGESRVDVRVLVSSPNGEVEIEVSAPIEPAPCDCEKPAAKTHTVSPGESLSKIGAKYGVTATAIARANHIANMNLIYVGQKLVIPAP